ncbi:uncharacterized protein LOC123223139 [Mangifera indica]|uniref:uncharacterized protein LOC123223139 n=1 Tax=Mangifera indica TaxID=29780 RepID=UPI001CFA71F0|nr:uncharacterized protein LOC123223139 [Mangifera indica]
MATKSPLSSFLSTKVSVLPKLWSQNPLTYMPPSLKPRVHFKIHAKLEGSDGEVKLKGKRKFVTREEEPDQFWQTAGEREGENPMKTPLPYIIIFGMSTPFIILAIAFANGWIKVPVR